MKSIFELPPSLLTQVPKINVASWARLLLLQFCIGAIAWAAASEISLVKVDSETSWMPGFIAGVFFLSTLAVCLLYSDRWFSSESNSGLPRVEGFIWLFVTGWLFSPVFFQQFGITDWLSVYDLFYFQLPLTYFLYWIIRQIVGKEIQDPSITHFIEKKEAFEVKCHENKCYLNISNHLFASSKLADLECGEVTIVYFLNGNNALLVGPDGQTGPVSLIEPYSFSQEVDPYASQDTCYYG